MVLLHVGIFSLQPPYTTNRPLLRRESVSILLRYNINQSEILASFWMDLQDQHARKFLGAKTQTCVSCKCPTVSEGGWGVEGERHGTKKIIFAEASIY